MKAAIELLATTRRLVEGATRDLSAETLRTIPPGFNNNILWNVGHLVVTQQILHYRLSGNDMAVDQKMCDTFMKGTSPKTWTEDPDYGSLIDQLHQLAGQLKEDYEGGLFKTWNDYTTSTGFSLGSIEDAIAFNNFHEGLHLGYILALKHAVG